MAFTGARSPFIINGRRQPKSDRSEFDVETSAAFFNEFTASIQDVQCAVATEDPFGKVVAGHLEIKAGIIPALIADDFCSGDGVVLQDFSRKTVIGFLMPDVNSEMQSIKVVHCIGLFKSGPGLALIPVPHRPATYRRIGYIHSPGLAHSAEATVTQLTII